MVWFANTKLGCAWSPIDCPAGQKGPDNPTGLVDTKQLVCLLTPGGNKWEQWYVSRDHRGFRTNSC